LEHLRANRVFTDHTLGQQTARGLQVEFGRELIRERQRDRIPLAERRGTAPEREKALTADRAEELRCRAAAYEKKAILGREFPFSRQTLDQYLKTSLSKRLSPQAAIKALRDQITLHRE
jgi:DNA invertase Pin-like site-specific DNA recombinase